jgi:hypothetical protein
MMPGVENIEPMTVLEGGVGEPVPASGGTIGTGSSVLAAWSGAGVNAGSLDVGLIATGISRRWPGFRPAVSTSPLTATMPVFETP